MKTVIYNYDDIEEKDINNIVKRAKLLIINSKNEIGVVFSHFNYFLIGGHVENDESDCECLNREVKEEMGVELDLKNIKRIYEIKYFNKDYPDKGKNTLSLINYYFLTTDVKPNINNLNLTQDEKYGNFHLEFIDVNKAVDKLTESLNSATKPGLVIDTIDVVKEYIKAYFPLKVKIHNMNLNDSPFQMIKKGLKTIELRLRDEKRKNIKENDIIVFTNRADGEIVQTRVIKIHLYNSFEELYSHFDKERLGYKESEIYDYKDMEKFYSKEEQDKYGVVGFEIELI